MIPVYLGGGYTGVLRCDECAASRETLTVKNKHDDMVGVHKYARGLLSFRRTMGRAPKSYQAEWAMVQRFQTNWMKQNKTVDPRYAWPNKHDSKLKLRRY